MATAAGGGTHDADAGRLAAAPALPRERVCWVLVDGIGDVSVPCLGHRTPLQAARTPAFDAVAAAGLNGLLDPVEPGAACGSDTAHMSLLGYDPRAHYRGRGAFESLGAGLDMGPGDVAFKCNFASVDDATGVVVSRRADRDFGADGPALCAALDGLAVPGFPGCSIAVRYATEHRAGLVLRGPGLTDAVAGTDPLRDGLPLRRAAPAPGVPADERAAAERTAAAINAASDAVRAALRAHPVAAARAAAGRPPANALLLRGPGRRLELPPFRERHAGMRGAVLAPTKIIAGLGMTLGMAVLRPRGATGAYGTDLAAKAAAAAAALARGAADFVLLHVKAVDDAGHDRAPRLKVGYLEAVDAMVAQLAARLWAAEAGGEEEVGGTRVGEGGGAGGEPPAPPRPRPRFALVLAADHSTPVEFGDHSHEPVPFAVAHLRHVVAALGGDAAVRRTRLGPIPVPQVGNAAPGEADEAAAGGGEGQACAPPAVVLGDGVAAYDEVAAARGALGRFPGGEAMALVKRFAGWTPADEEGGGGEPAL